MNTPDFPRPFDPTRAKCDRTRRRAVGRTGGVAGLAALALLAAACGGDEGSTATPAAQTPTTQAPTTQAPTTQSPTTSMESDDSMMGGTPFGPACSAVPEDGAGSFAGMAQDRAATAAGNNPLLSTLVEAVVAAELVDTLNGEGPFTIFAPVNDAFAALPEDDLNAVLADVDLLTSVLTFHVIAGENLDAEGLAAAGSAMTVQGGALTFGPDGTMVNGVDVICSDVTVANATVHIIDQVLLPGS